MSRKTEEIAWDSLRQFGGETQKALHLRLEGFSLLEAIIESLKIYCALTELYT